MLNERKESHRVFLMRVHLDKQHNRLAQTEEKKNIAFDTKADFVYKYRRHRPLHPPKQTAPPVDGAMGCCMLMFPLQHRIWSHTFCIFCRCINLIRPICMSSNSPLFFLYWVCMWRAIPNHTRSILSAAPWIIAFCGEIGNLRIDGRKYRLTATDANDVRNGKHHRQTDYVSGATVTSNGCQQKSVDDELLRRPHSTHHTSHAQRTQNLSSMNANRIHRANIDISYRIASSGQVWRQSRCKENVWIFVRNGLIRHWNWISLVAFQCEAAKQKRQHSPRLENI